MRSSSIVTLGANVHIESNLAGWGDSVGELFLGRVGRPALHFAGRAAGPGRVDALWVSGVMHCMPTRRAALALLVVAERNAARWPR